MAVEATEPNALRKATKRPPRDSYRTDTFSRVMVGGVRDPRELGANGRGHLRAAFENATRAPGTTGPQTALADLPEGNMRAYEVLVMHVVSPEAAGVMAFGVSRQSIWRWLKDGEDEACEDTAKRSFFLRTERALAVARGDLEERVALADPLAALTKGPIGRDGWTPRQQVQLANHDGSGPAEYRFVLTKEGSVGMRLMNPGEPDAIESEVVSDTESEKP